jgi:hypothetical protein
VRRLLVLLLVTACSKASESSDAKRMPLPPPPAASSAAEAASSIHVDVFIDGAAAPPIDGAKLAATKPDYQEDEHRVWKLATLVGPAADRAGAVIAATGDKGVTVSMPRPATDKDPVPVLTVNRRGEVMVEMIEAGDPFPGYHGRGGRLARPGDPLPRIVGVTAIRVSVP